MLTLAKDFGKGGIPAAEYIKNTTKMLVEEYLRKIGEEAKKANASSIGKYLLDEHVVPALWSEKDVETVIVQLYDKFVNTNKKPLPLRCQYLLNEIFQYYIALDITSSEEIEEYDVSKEKYDHSVRFFVMPPTQRALIIALLEKMYKAKTDFEKDSMLDKEDFDAVYPTKKDFITQKMQELEDVALYSEIIFDSDDYKYVASLYGSILVSDEENWVFYNIENPISGYMKKNISKFTGYMPETTTEEEFKKILADHS
jgi:hypothetical protein